MMAQFFTIVHLNYLPFSDRSSQYRPNVTCQLIDSNPMEVRLGKWLIVVSSDWVCPYCLVYSRLPLTPFLTVFNEHENDFKNTFKACGRNVLLKFAIAINRILFMIDSLKTCFLLNGFLGVVLEWYGSEWGPSDRNRIQCLVVLGMIFRYYVRFISEV